ncbi:MAG TPA: hypothetical protein VER58_03125 [Thermoanaerobaculia bacterium]|nr:hypothetical protein [Thermoanaerobaculia bacterium]
MEDIRSYNIDSDDTLRDWDELKIEREAAADDELPFEIPRD